jgi:hypothetical protein
MIWTFKEFQTLELRIAAKRLDPLTEEQRDLLGRIGTSLASPESNEDARAMLEDLEVRCGVKTSDLPTP